MLDLPSLLLDAAAVARTIQERPRVAPRPPSREQIEAVLEELPAAVERALEADPAAVEVMLIEAVTLPAVQLGSAVMRELMEQGVKAQHHDGKIFVHLPSLLAAAARHETARAVQAVAALWRGVAGPSSSALADAHSGTLTLSALGAAPNRRHVVAPGWASRPPAGVVEEARVAIGLPAWTLPTVAAAWTTRAGATATVAIEPGVFVGGRFFPASAVGTPGAAGRTEEALLFTLRPGVEAAAYAMTPATAEADVAAMVERAARDLGVPARGVAQVPTGGRADGRRSLRTPPMGLT